METGDHITLSYQAYLANHLGLKLNVGDPASVPAAHLDGVLGLLGSQAPL